MRLWRRGARRAGCYFAASLPGASADRRVGADRRDTVGLGTRRDDDVRLAVGIREGVERADTDGLTVREGTSVRVGVVGGRRLVRLPVTVREGVARIDTGGLTVREGAAVLVGAVLLGAGRVMMREGALVVEEGALGPLGAVGRRSSVVLRDG